MVPLVAAFAGRNPVAARSSLPYASGMIKCLFPMTLLLLAACSNGVNAPSLLPRAVEKQANTERPIAPPVNVASVTPALRGQIAELMKKVRDGDSAFAEIDRVSGGKIAAARRAPQGSEAWVAGQQAQSELEAARQDSAAALAEIENLLLVQTQAAASDPTVGGIAELAAAEADASATVARQGARLQELTR
jgi:hypothetical protein